GEGTVPGEGATLAGPEGRGGAQRLDPGDGTVRLAGHPQGQGAGSAGGLDADTVRQRQERTRPGDQQGGQQARARPDRGAGLAVVGLAAGECVEPVVRAALRCGQQAGAEGRHRGPGAGAVDRAVALPGAGRVAGGGVGEGLAPGGGLDGTAACRRGAGGGG